ncbi:class I tRNA ligase family protein, partial [Candidatus Peregrinibacteria bacterium]|nr:class I tRNA ligase family protein [Candidatus Peregrinibacteria bacterium]
AGLDPKFDEKKLDNYAKFVNKIWNAAKLVAFKGEGDYALPLADLTDLKLSSSAWILGYLDQVQTEYRKRLDNYEISNAFEVIYHFSWDIFCSWYLEIAKIELEAASEHTAEIKAVMFAAFAEVLKMLHAFMPFMTEEIWLGMEKMGKENLLAEQGFGDFSAYAGGVAASSESLLAMQKLIDMVTVAREVRRVLEKPFAEKLTVDFDGAIDAHFPKLIEKMVNADLGEVKEGIFKPSPSTMVRVAANAEEKARFKENLEKTLAKKQQEMAVLEKILTPGFKAKADPDLVAEREGQMAQVQYEVKALKEDLQAN